MNARDAMDVMMLPPNAALSTAEAVDGMVCPTCWSTLTNKAAFGPGPGRSMIPLRHYTGWCYTCQSGCDVIQFHRAGKWHMHQVRYFRIDMPPGDWCQMQPLPTAATEAGLPDVVTAPALKLGPGGDFAREISDEELKAMLQNVTEIYNKVGHFMIELLDVIKRKKQQT
jgi:hypothetical protein